MNGEVSATEGGGVRTVIVHGEKCIHVEDASPRVVGTHHVELCTGHQGSPHAPRARSIAHHVPLLEHAMAALRADFLVRQVLLLGCIMLHARARRDHFHTTRHLGGIAVHLVAHLAVHLVAHLVAHLRDHVATHLLAAIVVHGRDQITTHLLAAIVAHARDHVTTHLLLAAIVANVPEHAMIHLRALTTIEPDRLVAITGPPFCLAQTPSLHANTTLALVPVNATQVLCFPAQ